GKGGLPCSGEAEKEGAYTVMAEVGRAVHGEHVALRQQKIHDAENRLLHLTGIGCAADQNSTAHEVQQDENFGVRAIALRIGFEFGCGDHGELGMMGSQLLRCRPQEELSDKQVVPGVLVDEADGEAIGGIGSAEKILDIEFALAQMIHHPLLK